MADAMTRRQVVDRLVSHWSKHMAEIDAHVTNRAAARAQQSNDAATQAANQKGKK